MNVRKDILIPITKAGTAILTVNTTYVGRDKLDLIQIYGELVGSDCPGNFYKRSSPDNGRHWSKPELFFKPIPKGNGFIREMEPCFLFDEARNVIIYFFYQALFPGKGFSLDIRKYIRIYYRLSFDGGKSFNVPVQLIQEGHDETNWADNIVYGKNSFGLSFCAPLKIKDKILLPVYKRKSGNENSFVWPYEAGCFLGTWNDNKLDWKLSQLIKIDPEISSRGLSEPTCALLNNGTVIMVMRGSNANIPDKPSYKWMSISKDHGFSWSVPEPLKYNTGEHFFSPSSGSRLIRSSKNSKLYWLGNISSKNPQSNRPRFPLNIAEVDEDKKALIKSSVKVIEDKLPDDSSSVQFSNFRVYEDKATKEIVLIMARLQEKNKDDLTSPAYQYRIQI